MLGRGIQMALLDMARVYGPWAGVWLKPAAASAAKVSLSISEGSG
jgi:hypothetical protein